MKKRIMMLALLACIAATAAAQQMNDIKLNKPDMSRRGSMMKAFHDRKATRVYADKELSLQDLSDLLWAANGYNRPDEQKRTAPSASNNQEIDVYAFTKNGVYLYDAASHSLKQVSTTDARKYVGTQEYACEAPLLLLIVSDMSRYQNKGQITINLTGVNAGIVSQNISLFCSGAGLATVTRGSMNREKISELLGFGPDHILHVNHPVGYIE